MHVMTSEDRVTRERIVRAHSYPTSEFRRRVAVAVARRIAGAPLVPGTVIDYRDPGGNVIGQAVVLEDGTVQIKEQ